MTTRATSRATCAAFTARRWDRLNPSDPTHTEYNQVINGGKYYTQAEFSNLAYSKQGVGAGCQQSEADAQHLSGNASGAVASIFSGRVPGDPLPADGTSTTKDRIVVADALGLRDRERPRQLL